MSDAQSILAERAEWNRFRFDPDSDTGHYESYFQRANHPHRPLAFWIRYTLFSPAGRRDDTVGELWAIYFDGEEGVITAAKEVFPFSRCSFAKAGLDARIGEATLDEARLEGSARTTAHELRWSLAYEGGAAPLLLLPRAMYTGGFPKAKAVVGTPGAQYEGELVVDGEEIRIEGWTGSQNHNWGSRHTDSYAWGQVAGFDNERDAFLECGTAQIRVGPLWTPPMTLMVLRMDGREYRLNGLLCSLRATGRFKCFDWNLASTSNELKLRGRIQAPAATFVGLTYNNPPGGTKTCLNSKLATCQLTVEQRGQSARTLVAAKRVAFEILTDATDHGVPVVA